MAGWGYVRQAIETVIGWVSSVTDNVILVGHVKDKALADASGQETGSIKCFDLTGKTANILSAKSDAIAYVFRDENSNLVLNFEASDALVGARPEHLANKKIIIAERQEDGTFISKWDDVYPSLKK